VSPTLALPVSAKVEAIDTASEGSKLPAWHWFLKVLLAFGIISGAVALDQDDAGAATYRCNWTGCTIWLNKGETNALAEGVSDFLPPPLGYFTRSAARYATQHGYCLIIHYNPITKALNTTWYYRC
jgi:hypothetical protein